MSIFGTIMEKIFHHPAAAAEPPVSAAAPAAAAAAPAQAGDTAPAPAAPSAPSPAGTSPAPVDVGAVLGKIASDKGVQSDWQQSIVDLLKLLDMDSSLEARKQLASELNVHVGADGTAQENIALHKAVMDKLAENGGKIPDSLKH